MGPRALPYTVSTLVINTTIWSIAIMDRTSTGPPKPNLTPYPFPISTVVFVTSLPPPPASPLSATDPPSTQKSQFPRLPPWRWPSLPLIASLSPVDQPLPPFRCHHHRQPFHFDWRSKYAHHQNIISSGTTSLGRGSLISLLRMDAYYKLSAKLALFCVVLGWVLFIVPQYSWAPLTLHSTIDPSMFFKKWDTSNLKNICFLEIFTVENKLFLLPIKNDIYGPTCDKIILYFLLILPRDKLILNNSAER